MTFKEFNELDKMDQLKSVLDKGTELSKRTEGGHKIVLYQVFAFYVELYYLAEINILRMMASFPDADKLDVYISRFNINYFGN
ncbi:MAG: hypothetical protein QM791_17645 [Ferruginibacter sp.]